MTERLSAILRTLANEPRDEHPILSVYLDWTIDQNGQHPAMAQLESELDQLVAQVGERGPGRESFDADRERILAYLRGDETSDAKGIVIFACDARRIWVTLPLLVPVQTEIAADGYPHLFQLARLVDDHETYVVATVEGQEAQVYVLGIDNMGQVESTEAREEINRVQVGGWSQMRYERHVGYVLRLHLQELGATLQKVMTEHDAQYLVIAANDSIKGPIRQELPQAVLDKLVDHIAGRQLYDAEQLFAELEPKMREIEDQQEQALVERLHTQLASKGGLAFEGAGKVAEALLKGQVDTLLISPNLEGEASESLTTGMLRVGRRDKDPIDGSNMMPIELREGLVLHTLRQGGKVEFISADNALEEHGGVAALLRYRDDQVQPEMA